MQISQAPDGKEIYERGRKNTVTLAVPPARPTGTARACRCSNGNSGPMTGTAIPWIWGVDLHHLREYAAKTS